AQHLDDQRVDLRVVVDHQHPPGKRRHSQPMYHGRPAPESRASPYSGDEKVTVLLGSYRVDVEDAVRRSRERAAVRERIAGGELNTDLADVVGGEAGDRAL